MKYGECPLCGSKELADYWVAGRKLQQCCYDCSWKGEIRIPELKPIKTSKVISANHFSGFHFEIFDRYGHTILSSKSYYDEKEAQEEIKNNLERHNKNENIGPCTAVLWPDKIKVEGKVYKDIM